MTDIVERLREGIDGDAFGDAERLMSEAADEIERLQAIEKAAWRAFKYHLSGYKSSDFDANEQLALMDALGRALETKPRDPDEGLPTAEDVRGILREKP